MFYSLLMTYSRVFFKEETGLVSIVIFVNTFIYHFANLHGVASETPRGHKSVDWWQADRKPNLETFSKLSKIQFIYIIVIDNILYYDSINSIPLLDNRRQVKHTRNQYLFFLINFSFWQCMIMKTCEYVLYRGPQIRPGT